MSRPHVTITLGSSGQKVVKRPWANSDNFLVDTPTLSGSKRFPADRNAEDSLFSTNKRLRGDVIQRNSRYSGPSDVRIGDDDLRLKLLRKRMDKRMRLVEQKKIELGEKMSRTIQSSEGPDRSMLRNIPPYRRAGESLRMESLRSPYSSHSMERSRQKSPDNIPKISGGMSSSRSTDEVLRLPPPRPIETSRLMRSDLLDLSRSRGSASMSIMTSSMRTNLDMCKPVKEIPPASSSILRSPFPVYPEEPLTVSSLLHSLGLGKYAIHFQAEEVDMAALKQMGDRDLKELGIPMVLKGPRKKILLAMLARSKRPIA